MRITDYSMTPTAQKIFIVLIVVTYALLCFTSGQQLLSVLEIHNRISEFVIYTVLTLMLPIVFFSIAMFAIPRRQKSRLWRYFEALLLLSMANTFLSVLAGILQAVTMGMLHIPLDMRLRQGISVILTLIAFGWVLYWLRKKSSADNIIPPFIQKIFIIVMAGSLLFTALITGYYVVSQLSTNQNVGGFLIPLIQLLFTPVIMFCIPYFTNDAKKTGWTRVFHGAFYSMIGMMLFALITLLAAFVDAYIMEPYYQNYWAWIAFTAGKAILAIIVFVVILRNLRLQPSTP